MFHTDIYIELYHLKDAINNLKAHNNYIENDLIRANKKIDSLNKIIEHHKLDKLKEIDDLQHEIEHKIKIKDDIKKEIKGDTNE